ncbi:MAG: 1-O-methyltransferase [Actinomycetota bacterium]|nr:1-O-methyltransferase [Actinomycetota bacterium]
MPEEEGIALFRAACSAGAVGGPLLEIGTFCGKSAIYLGAAARVARTVLFTIDHHRGSEEHQPGEGYHDERLEDEKGRIDTLPEFRRTIDGAGLWDVVIAVVGESASVAQRWATPLAMVFVDGGHSHEAAHSDFTSWAPHIAPGGLLVIHDVFPDPDDGGRPPFEIYERALDSDRFTEINSCGSLRVLRKHAPLARAEQRQGDTFG